MKTLKKLFKVMIFPHIAVLIPLVPLAVGLLIYAFTRAESTDVISYIAYIVSAYTLTVLCARTPELIRLGRQIKAENKYIVLYTGDAALRVKLSLYSSLIINTAYAVLQMGMGIYHATVWFYALAAYYILLAVMRFFLLKDVRARKAGEDLLSEYVRYRFCGIVLAFMNLALGIIVFYITWQGRGFVHHYITTIAMAAYTFGSLTMAVINIVKYRKYESPVLSAAKAISLASALVSLLTLETAMISAFGEDSSEAFRAIMTGATGIAVCVLVLSMAVYMIVNSTNKIRHIKRGKLNGE